MRTASRRDSSRKARQRKVLARLAAGLFEEVAWRRRRGIAPITTWLPLSEARGRKGSRAVMITDNTRVIQVLRDGINHIIGTIVIRQHFGRPHKAFPLR